MVYQYQLPNKLCRMTIFARIASNSNSKYLLHRSNVNRSLANRIVAATIMAGTSTTNTWPSFSHSSDNKNNSNHDLTPAEAGRRAQAIVKGTKDSSTQQHPTTTSMDTILSHTGFVPYDDDNHHYKQNIDSKNDDMTRSNGSIQQPQQQQQRPMPWNAPIAPPIYLSTTYIRPAHGTYNTETDAIYIREGNPTRILFEQQMSKLELLLPTGGSSTATSLDSGNTTCTSDANSCYSFAMSSGMMAISTAIMAHSLPIHILLPIDLYHGVPSFLQNVLIPFTTTNTSTQQQQQPMITFERVDMRYVGSSTTSTTTISSSSSSSRQSYCRSFHEAIQDTPLTTNLIVWIETPSNPLCHMIDIGTICSIARSIRSNNTTIVVDSTLAPPNITQPLLIQPTAIPTTSSQNIDTKNSNSQPIAKTNGVNGVDGVDVVLHAATKYIGGHSDAMGGIITVSPHTARGRQLFQSVQNIQCHQGGIMSSIDSYMMIRGLRTLHVRVERQCTTAHYIANYLYDQYGHDPKNEAYIKRIYYPGLRPSETSEQYEFEIQQYNIAQKQMKNELYGSIISIEFYTEQQAMAFIGGLRTILRATSFGGTETLIEHRASIEPIGQQTSPAGLVRLSVGLEDRMDLIADIESAIKVMKCVCK